MADVRIGISGFRYPGWRKQLYPADLPQRRELQEGRDIDLNFKTSRFPAPSWRDWAHVGTS